MTELRPDPKNARKHSDRNKKAIKESLDAVGAGRSILADADGIVRAGNGVFEQWGNRPVKIVETDGKELVVVQRTDLRGKDAIRAAALDNIAADSSAHDYDAAILAAIANDDEIVKRLAQEDAKLMTLLAGDRVVNDPLAEWQGMPEFHQEDLLGVQVITVHFQTQEAVQEFANLIQRPITEKTKTIWYPAPIEKDRFAIEHES